MRRLGDDGIDQQLREITMRLHLLDQLLNAPKTKFLGRLENLGKIDQSLSQCREVSRTGKVGRATGNESFYIRQTTKCISQITPMDRRSHEPLHRVMPELDLGSIQEWLLHPATQQAQPH